MIDDDECGAVGGLRIGRRNRSTRRKPAPVPLCPPQIPHDLTWARTRAAAMGSRRLTAWAMARSADESHASLWMTSPVFTTNMCGQIPSHHQQRQDSVNLWAEVRSPPLRPSHFTDTGYWLHLSYFSSNVLNWTVETFVHQYPSAHVVSTRRCSTTLQPWGASIAVRKSSWTLSWSRTTIFWPARSPDFNPLDYFCVVIFGNQSIHPYSRH
jgi:hypothetical protein